MPNDQGNPPEKYALEGRLVTLGPLGVIDDGAIYVDGERIFAVLEASAPPPAGFEGALRLRTGDTLYPGLIELHNHLSYNAMPLWHVPRRFSNNNQWKNLEDYKRFITKPSQVLGRTPGVVEALVRFVECRCLLGGTTTSQGITLASAGHIGAIYKGVVRNVEQPLKDFLEKADTKIANPEKGKAKDYLENLKGKSCYLQHLSEGVDAAARGWFLQLNIVGDEWAVNDAFCGIHSTALKEEDFRVIAERGGSMVWSPLSNYLLYGATVDLKAAKAAGIKMGIGCDWGPSGSKNLLGELKVAWLASREQGGEAGPVFSAEELVRMATVNGAAILKWDDHLGTLEAGRVADIIAINGRTCDPYELLINARETALTLAVIGGVPRLGQKKLMESFGYQCEEIKVGSSSRLLYLEQEDAHPLTKGLTLTEATARLSDAMARLPELAETLDAGSNDLFECGSLDPNDERWHVVFDLAEEDGLEFGALPLGPYVQPMELPPITVADDPDFLRQLAVATNLPEFVREGLPGLYGEEISPADVATFLKREKKLTGSRLSNSRSYSDFANFFGELTRAERLAIVKQAQLILEGNYVHLHMKKAMYGIDPLQRLQVLAREIEDCDEGTMPPEVFFHRRMADVFLALRDLHTAYRAPRPFRGKVAWLPFTIEKCREEGKDKYLLTKLVADAGPSSLKAGVEILNWNGVPLPRLLKLLAEKQAGANEAAKEARAMESLTLRPLVAGIPPEEDWVDLRYKDLNGSIAESRHEWLIFEPEGSARGIDSEGEVVEAAFLAYDPLAEDLYQAKKSIYAYDVLEKERKAATRKARKLISNAKGGFDTYLPTIFKAKPIATHHGEFGYIRIFTFNVNNANGFVDEFVRLVGLLPQRGLIIDVRGNGGGLIPAAEQLLQVLTPKPIEPSRAQFLASTANFRLCQSNSPSPHFPGFNLEEWESSLGSALKTGADYSIGYPITPTEDANKLGQRYYGPVLLIVDALCYSATDIFAAGFQDHGIGPVLGTAEATGAGGANVWSHSTLSRLSPADSSFEPLPKGSDMRVAIRRVLRVGKNAGSVLEGFGVKPDYFHEMTRKDVMEGNADLIERAATILSEMKVHSLDLAVQERAGKLPLFKLRAENVDRVDLFVGDRPLKSYDVQDNRVDIDPVEAVTETYPTPDTFILKGYEEGRLVIEKRSWT